MASKKKFLRITVSDRSVWQIPAEVVARKRAVHYAERDTGKKSGAAFDKAYLELFEVSYGDNNEITDWAANNMDWEDVKDISVRVVKPGKTADYHDDWTNAPMEVVTV